MAVNANAKSLAVTVSSQSSVEDVQLFDALVAQVGRALIRATVDEMDAAINSCLKRTGIDLGLDRCTLAQIDPVTGVANFTHGWAREPYRLVSQSLNANRLLPWTVERILAGQTVVMSSPDKLPKEAAVDRESFLRYGPKSNVMVPIRVGGIVVRGMSFAALRRERGWPAHTVQGFEAIGEIFSLGLERKRAVADLAASMVYELNQPLAAILSNAEAMAHMLTSRQPDLDEIRAIVADSIQDNSRASETLQRIWATFEHVRSAGRK